MSVDLLLHRKIRGCKSDTERIREREKEMKLHDNALILSHIVIYQHIVLCVFYQYRGGIVWITTEERQKERVRVEKITSTRIIWK